MTYCVYLNLGIYININLRMCISTPWPSSASQENTPAGPHKSTWCSHVTALEPTDCLRANKRTQLTALRFRALLVKHDHRAYHGRRRRPRRTRPQGRTPAPANHRAAQRKCWAVPRRARLWGSHIFYHSTLGLRVIQKRRNHRAYHNLPIHPVRVSPVQSAGWKKLNGHGCMYRW